MQWSTEDRLRFLSKLAGIDRVITAGYRFLLGLLIAAIIAGAAAVVVTNHFGPGNQGEWFYFTCIVLLALGWAVKEFVKAGRRQRRRDLPVSIRSANNGAAHTWEFRWGSSAAAEHEGDGAAPFGIQLKATLPGIVMPLATLRRDELPDESAVHMIKAELDRGVKLEDAILLVQPAFAEWSALEQRAYVNSLLSGQPTGG
jgi:hypothetical protein